ncbi:vWA domain-containing protein [Rubripirellula tenax]|nr:vWA domain-containing protein [Rubripirellula tenax]
MSKDSDHPTAGPPEDADENLRRLLELQLVKIRCEASAARLDAQAAEIELMMRKMRGTQPTNKSTEPRFEGPKHVIHRVDTAQSQPMSAPKRFSTWDEVHAAQQRFKSVAFRSPSPAPISLTPISPTPISPTPFTRFDSAGHAVPRPRFLDLDSGESTEAPLPEVDEDVCTERPGVEADPEPKKRFIGEETSAPLASVDLEDVQIDEDDDEAEHASKRRRPSAIVFSAVMHVVALLVLAGIGLKTHTPKDQVALSASATSASETAIENFEIETSEAVPETEVADPMASDTEFEISPIGELAVTQFSPDAAPTAPTSMASLSSSASSAASAMSMKSVSNKKMEFCGVEGGGNHFVYLVDSSGSMHEAFDSAIEALLGSIDLLTPDQRFYVIVYDKKPDYMRLSDPNVDEPRSVFATDENKQALKRWVRRVTRDLGWAPYEPVKFALEMRPDVIFLLSDGEFTQKFEDMLAEENVVTNLFGDSKPISIIHTIAYHSKVGESGMKRIAKQHGGQFRYVPKP